MQNNVVRGWIVGIFASVFWGFTAIFFKQMDAFLPLEIASHRVLWTVVTLAIFGYFTARYARLKDALTNWRELRLMIISALMMGMNWFCFIYAIDSNQIVEAGLGYFIYPLMVVTVGVLFLGEKLGRWEWIAVLLAGIGVIVKTYANDGVPFIALIVAATFTLYTLLGKTRSSGPVVGIWAECIVLLPIVFAYLGYLHFTGEGQFIHGGGSDTLLAVATGPITALPLILYIASSRAIGMAMAGLLFYITPVLHVAVGALIYKEPFGLLDAVAFGVIWIGLTILTISQFLKARKNKGA